MPVVGDKATRFLKVEKRDHIDLENRTVELAFASELPYERWWGIEITDIKSMDLTRLSDGGALLYNHDHTQHIGKIEKVWIDDDLIARAVVRFSRSAIGEEKFQDVQDGILEKVSYGYEITKMTLEKEENDVGTYRVNVAPFEISMVHTPADISVGVGKSLDAENIVNVSNVDETDNNLILEVSEMEQKTENVETPAIDTEAIEKAAFEKGKLETEAYHAEVKSLCELAGFESEADKFINEGIEVKHVRETLVELKAKQDKEEIQTMKIETIGDNKAQRTAERVNQLAALLNPACEQSKSERFDGVHGLAKTLMVENGVDVSMMNGENIKEMILSKDHSTSDFPIILKDAANKALLNSFDAQLAVQTFRPLVRERQVRDYKEINVSRLGESPELVAKPEGAEYASGTVSETGESYKVSDHARMISFTDRAMRDDDLNAFSRGLLQFGSSAARAESTAFYDEFINGLVGGNAIYSAGHGNLSTTTLLDITGLSTVREKLMKQTGLDSSAPLNLMGSYLIVPPSMLTDAQQLMSANYVANEAGKINPFGGSMTIISDARLADGSWYVASDLGQIDLFEMAYLSGRRAPMLDQRVNFMTDSLDAKIKHTFGTKVIDYRGLQKASV